MKWFKKEMLLLVIIFMTLTGGLKKVFAIEEANEDQKTTLLESQNDPANPFSEHYSYFYDITVLENYIKTHYTSESQPQPKPTEIANLYIFADSVVPQNKVTSLANCRNFANYVNTVRIMDPNLAATVFVTSVRCMLDTHYSKMRAAFHKFKKHKDSTKNSTTVRAQVCDHFSRENGLLHTLINDINFWNTYYKGFEVGKPPLSFTPGTFYEQKKYLIFLLNAAEGIVPHCPLFPVGLFANTKQTVNLIAFSGPSVT